MYLFSTDAVVLKQESLSLVVSRGGGGGGEGGGAMFSFLDMPTTGARRERTNWM